MPVARMARYCAFGGATTSDFSRQRTPAVLLTERSKRLIGVYGDRGDRYFLAVGENGEQHTVLFSLRDDLTLTIANKRKPLAPARASTLKSRQKSPTQSKTDIAKMQCLFLARMARFELAPQFPALLP